MKFFPVQAALAALLFAPAAFAGPLPSKCSTQASSTLQNCGFETDSFSGWTLSGAEGLSQPNLYGIDQYEPNSGSFDAFFANQGATLGVHTPSDSLVLSQNASLETGRAYTLSFYLMQDTPVSLGYTNYFSVAFDGVTLMAETAAAATNGYVLEDFTVVGAGSDTLAFSFQNDAGTWFLDDVAFTQIPEPATAVVLGVGMLGLAFARRRRG